ncbi:fatty acid synthase [Fistulina hepatica ATCC 64428]|nr:fatty acid synthase [Fistulina hepatica ATCC 64428]
MHANSVIVVVTRASVRLAVAVDSAVAHVVSQAAHTFDATTAVFQWFVATFLGARDVHSVTAAQLDSESRVRVLRSFFDAQVFCEGAHPHSLLLSENTKATPYALFGGQGTNHVYFAELQALHATYASLITPFLAAMSTLLAQLAASVDDPQVYFAYGLDFINWLISGELPPTPYLASVPVSFPLIGLTQLAQFLVTAKTQGLTPAQLRNRFHGATGHSQGLVSALAISALDSTASDPNGDFNIHAARALRWLFFAGLRAQQAVPPTVLPPDVVKDCVDNGEGAPSAMLSVSGLALKEVEKVVAKTNGYLKEGDQLAISLHNTPTTHVVTGPPRSLVGLVGALRKLRGQGGNGNESKTPHSQRAPSFTARFLATAVPYHSAHLEGVTEKVLADLGSPLWQPADLHVPVFNTEDGSDMRVIEGTDELALTRSLCDQIFTRPIHWARATEFGTSARAKAFPATDKVEEAAPAATHIVDFGPGGASGIGPLTARALAGRGVRVVLPGAVVRGMEDVLPEASEALYDSVRLRRSCSWAEEFGPKLVTIKGSNDTLALDTRMSRLLGKPPIMVPGMTPTTVQAGFVSAILRAGYHVELAGGAHFAPFLVRAKVKEIVKQIPTGTGLTLNSLYINPMLFTFQLPLWQQLRTEGAPVEGFCVAAGIPTPEKASEIIAGLRAAGVRHVSFKPGSVEGIRQDYPILLQWTGGRAGGHHSYEDFHAPIRATYASIRRQRNIILIGGSGFGNAEDVWKYLTGEWASEGEDGSAAPMPFDGFLFGSRVMVAKEAHTSDAVKDLIVAAPGVDDAQWEGTYSRPTGGILTVRSELGEPIHKVATRGVKLWREFDDTVFSLPNGKRGAWLSERRAEVVRKLNRDSAKPWFPAKLGESSILLILSLGDMTYEEVALRMVRLLFVLHQSRWIDVSLRNLTGDWIRRVEERFAGVNGSPAPKPSLLQSFAALDDPVSFMEKFFAEYPLAQTQLLCSEDTAYFLAINQRTTQKPVPYIPVLDSSFEVWFKKDSLWAAEDVDGVFDQDAQRVCILQGPVAAKRSTVKDEPIADLLNGINKGLIDRMLDARYAGDASKIPCIDYLAPEPAHVADCPNVKVVTQNDATTYTIDEKLPGGERWISMLAGPKLSWLRALLTAPTLVRAGEYGANPLPRILAPRAGQRVVVKRDSATGIPVSLQAYGAARSFGVHNPAFQALDISFDSQTKDISITMFEERTGAAVPLRLVFEYHPEQGSTPIHERAVGRNHAIKAFYWKLWFGDEAEMPANLDVCDTFEGPEVTIREEDVQTFCNVVGNLGEKFRGADAQAPMDFAIVTGWQAIMKAIFPASIDGDLLKLLHLTNGFKMMPGASPLKVGDVCKASARIVSVINTDAGKQVKVKGHVSRGDVPVIEVVSSFLYRGAFTHFENTFETTEEPDYLVPLPTDAAVGVLQSKEWFEWTDSERPLTAGTSLVFCTRAQLAFRDKTTFRSVAVEGEVFIRNHLKILERVGTVDWQKDDSHGNPVLAYLQRHGTAEGLQTLLPNGGYSLATETFQAPFTNEPYSKISGDFNPIHVNPYFSDYASLPATIVHGLWSSAATRRYVETVVAHGKPERVVAYDVSFVGMVKPGDNLSVNIRHVGMRDGNIVVKVATSNADGETVLEGSAEVVQPTTAYVFTGQGSQEPGMGMDLYASSPAARAVWDGADAHLLAVYGFSIIEIVKDNPKEKTIHFGGIKGQAIRKRYMDMTYDTMDKDGHVRTLPLFADINIRTPKYTFSHPNGLLFATQFAQIALVVTEKAAFEDMHAKGFMQKDCAFAGHSLGEYSALASIADVLEISALVDVVFYRGITMQRAVERDAQNRSNYAMCAVNPGRVSKTFSDAALREVVDGIAESTGTLLQIVNYNVEGQQYVCAGELVALQTLTNVLNYLKVKKVDIVKLTEEFTEEKVKEMFKDIVQSCYESALELQKSTGYIILERGFATIPLPGIDVPFHSRYLWAGVLPFRAYLSKKINPDHLNPDTLVGKYIPNLIALPFEVSREYAQIIYDQTSSPRLDKVLKQWDAENWGSEKQRQKLAYIILVELLAYQFASPVRWIETQDQLFTVFNFERLIELGPSPTLTGMATRTLKAKYEVQDDSVGHSRAILCHAKHHKEIYHEFEDQVEEVPTPEAAEEPSSVSVTAVSTPVAAVAVAAAVPAGPAASIEDAPISATEILTVIVAQKLKKAVNEVPMSKSIKDLVGGKSTLQNEILGDLQLEFSSAPEKGEELPLEELGSALGTGFGGNLGKHTTAMVSRLIGGKMPGGFNMSAAKSYLSKRWGLGSLRADSVLLLGTTLEPPKRLGSEAEAKAWLDNVVSIYAQRTGISLTTASGATGAASSGAITTINSKEFIKFQAEQERFAQQHIELYMRYLKRDSRAGELAFDAEKANSGTLQAKLDSIMKEHGDTYIDGIMPVFDTLKARHFDSSWNWVRQDALMMFYDIIFGRLTTVDREITARCIRLLNRADPDLVTYMQYHIDQVDPTKGETYKLAKTFGQQLIDNTREAVGIPPVYKDVTFPTAPHTEVTAKGDIVYSEVVRENVRKLEAYVEEMASGDGVAGTVNIQKVQDDVLKLWTLVKSQPNISQEQKNRIKALYEGVVRSLRKNPEPRPRITAPRNRRSSSQFLRPQVSSVMSVSADKVPLLHLKRKVGTTWEYSSNLTGVYLDVLHEIATSGTTFKDKNALLTGVGKGSIGVEVVKGLLSGGAHVVITTSRYSRSTVEYYQGIYQMFGSRGSALTVVPFNQGSKQDVEALVDYIYTTLGMDLDYILPFAGIPENGREIDDLDDKSELAHRIMLVNLLHILGAVKTKKATRNFVTRPTQVILPLSPNHGLFGNDGLYSESKISLETLFQRWASESWGEYLCLAGAVIGWTRGTGLMGPTNIVAHELESYGVRTFSSKEMAFNILGLMHPLLFSITQVEPIWADLNGGMDRLPDLAEITKKIRTALIKKSELRRAVTLDNSADFKVVNGGEAERLIQKVNITPRANFRFEFPELPSVDSLADLSKLRGVIDLDKVVVITGFAEVGPWGSSRTRWEMEARGEFTIEGCIEMAWIMGYIKHFDGRLKDGQLYVGWVDSKSSEPVDDKDVKGRYEKEILAHAGIRLIEPELFRGYDPKRKVFHQEVELIHDLEPIEIAEDEAQRFKLQHGEKCDIWAGEGGQWFAKFKKGALILVPKAFQFSRLVAGQIPTGWSAGRYGIPEDIVTQVDRVSLWALVCVAEAMNMSGITDPYELYQHIHPSEISTSLGSGMGGVSSMQEMFRDRREEKEVQNDVLQETFINTTAGWVNLLLLSSSGPVKIPVGACTTALQSMEIAADTVLSGKAKIMIAGGFDDISEEGSYEFANMKATSNAETEFAMGREPTEMSRPATSTRSGFMESQGTGVHIVMSAKTALELGAPIRGVLAFTSTATDKAGRSIPALGVGALAIAREVPSKYPLPILDLAYRSRQLSFRRQQISQWLTHEQFQLQEEVEYRKSQGEPIDDNYISSRVDAIEKEAAQQEKDALAVYGMLEGTDARVSPLRRALAIWDLTGDNIGVLSIHGTSTKANEENETRIWNDIFTNLSRTAGNAVPIMAQKSLLGHSKGGSAAWQLAGLLQSVFKGIIPGNRNSDNIDAHFQDRQFLMFPSKTIHTDGIRAGIMSSFGFGQVGGIALILHPRYLLGALEPAQYETYKVRNAARALQSYKAMSEMMVKNSLVKVKEAPPYTKEMEVKVLLNSMARASLDPKTGSYKFTELKSEVPMSTANVGVVKDLISKGFTDSAIGVGVDEELISAVPSHNPTFVARNFTDAEVAYCSAQPSPSSSFAARWAGKEAVFKALGVKSKGAAASMRDIEIVVDSETGAPGVVLHGEAQAKAAEKSISKVLISLSHSETVAIAFAQATSS